MQGVLELGGYATMAAAFAYAFVELGQSLMRWRQHARRAMEEREFFRLRCKSILRTATMHREREEHTWSGNRKFFVDRKVVESRNGSVCSFYLKPHDQKPLPPFEPGQFLTFKLNILGQPKDIIRCYSLSDSPLERDYYRVTIKRVPPPRDKPDLSPGVSSNFFHDQLTEGAILDVSAPNGNFCLDQEDGRPVVLIGGGVGLTPVLSMLNTIAKSDTKRETWFFYGAMNSEDAAMTDHLRAIEKANANIRVVICYSQPTENCRRGHDYDISGHCGIDALKSLLPSNNFEFYICGPPPMMATLVPALDEWGVPENDVKFEAFGPATIKKTPDAVAEGNAPGAKITFSSAGKTVNWTASSGSILELAEANGISIASGCRAGSCGTCATALKSGKVKYLDEPSTDVNEGSCLVCIAVPNGDVQLRE